MSNELVKGSIADVAQKSGTDIAKTFMQAKVVCIYDSSGSMGIRDGGDAQTRHERAKAELITIQNNMPGEVALICFSNRAEFIPTGYPAFYGDSTNLARALKLAKMADKIDGMRFIIISDGYPDSQERALAEAERFQNRIDVVYVGPEDIPTGRDFLERLATGSKGKVVTADIAQDLAGKITYLLTGEIK